MKKLIVAFALMASPAIAGPITDRLSETPGGTFASSKAPAELELCATDVVVSFSGLTPIIIGDDGARDLYAHHHSQRRRSVEDRYGDSECFRIYSGDESVYGDFGSGS